MHLRPKTRFPQLDAKVNTTMPNAESLASSFAMYPVAVTSRAKLRRKRPYTFNSTLALRIRL